jgi:hypothetical protein
MNRIVPWLAIVLASGAAVAACSSPAGARVSPKTCALISACGGVGDFLMFGALCELLDAEGVVDPSLLSTREVTTRAKIRCAEAANDCASVQACLAVPASAAAVCNGGMQGRCSGRYAVQCGLAKLGGLTQGDDCGGSGLVCVEDNGGATCGTAACDATATPPHCDGDALVTCSGGALMSASCKQSASTSCSGSGSTCQTQVAETCGFVNGNVQCVGTGAACDEATTGNSCDGTSIVSCTGGQTARLDCAGVVPGTTCRLQSDGSAACVGTSTECTNTTPETCANGVIGYCMWGVKATVDCKAYGLSGCTTFTTGSGTGAACTP